MELQKFSRGLGAPRQVIYSVADIIGREHISTFLKDRKNRVLVILDEGQDEYRKAAEEMVAILTDLVTPSADTLPHWDIKSMSGF